MDQDCIKLTSYFAERHAGISGATAIRGLWGFSGDHAPHGGTRHVPTVTIVIDRPGRIGTAFGVIDELTSRSGFVTSETVRAVRVGGDL